MQWQWQDGWSRHDNLLSRSPKMPRAHPADLVIGLCCSSSAGLFRSPRTLRDRSPECLESPGRPALWGKRHCQPATSGLVAVIAVVDLLLVVASFVMQGSSPTGRWWVGMDECVGFVDAETGFHAVLAPSSGTLCAGVHSKLNGLSVLGRPCRGVCTAPTVSRPASIGWC